MNHIFHRDRWKVHDPRFALLRLYPYITFTSYTHKYRSTENAYYHPFPLLNDILRVDPNLRSIIKKRKNLSLLSNLLSSSIKRKHCNLRWNEEVRRIFGEEQEEKERKNKTTIIGCKWEKKGDEKKFWNNKSISARIDRFPAIIVSRHCARQIAAMLTRRDLKRKASRY